MWGLKQRGCLLSLWLGCLKPINPGIPIVLQPGTYCYQFLVNGTWMTSPDMPVGPDDDGHLCNKASATSTFQLIHKR